MGKIKLALVIFVVFLVTSVSARTTNAIGLENMNVLTDFPVLLAPDVESQSSKIIGHAAPVWQQVNSTGLGDPGTLEVTALGVFNGYLYAGTHNPIDPVPQSDGTQIFRSQDGTTWVPVTDPGFGITHDIAPPAILDLEFFNSRLYASTGRGDGPGQIWRTADGVNWASMVIHGFGNPDTTDITALAVYNNMIYAGAINQISGAQIWRSFSGDSNTWTQVSTGSGVGATSISGFVVFNGALYAAVESNGPAQLWRTTGSSWTTVMNNGFGNSLTKSLGGMTVFGGYLYVGAGNTTEGAQLWRSNDGTTWQQVITPGFGDPNNQQVEAVFAFQNQLYAGVQNAVTGIELWRWTNGVQWEQIDQDGFSNSNNSSTNGSNAAAEFQSQLFIGILNSVDGGQIWQMLGQSNGSPTDIFLSNSTVDENQPVNTLAGVLSAADPDAGDTFTFSLACAVPGADNAAFNILGTDLRTSAVFDFETKSSYSICVRVTDLGGLTFDKNFTVTVNNLPENAAPTDIFLSNSTVDENQPVDTLVGVLSAADPDAGETFTFSLACAIPGTDDAVFNILGTDLRTSAVFDFETRSSYSICVRVTDFGGLTFDKNFTITVNNLPENAAPTDIFLSNSTVDENQPVNTVVGALSAADPDAGETFTFSLACAVPGADDAAFNILGTNLRTSAVFDFETRSSYSICVRVTDFGGLSFDKNFTVTVNNLPENAAPTDIFLTNSTVDENQPANTVVGVLSAADPDAGETFTFGLACAVPGADDAAFNILGTDLRTSTVFDYETRSSYDICVRVTDFGGLSFDKNFIISVNDIFDPANTPGKITGGGSFNLSNGKATFGFVVTYGAGDENPSGNLLFIDRSMRLKLKAISFDSLMIEKNHVRFTGTGITGTGQVVEFVVEVNDLNKLGQKDTFHIYIPALEGYKTGGALTGGNITIHKYDSGWINAFPFQHKKRGG